LLRSDPCSLAVRRSTYNATCIQLIRTETTNVSFERNDPVNTLIIDTDTEAHLYQVSTPRKISGRTTTIRRLNDSRGSSEPAAQIQWRPLSAAFVSINGTEWIPVNDFLVRSSRFSRSVSLSRYKSNLHAETIWNDSSRTFVAPNGDKYEWKKDWRKFSVRLESLFLYTSMPE
jgi:hypothetical protein